MPKLQHFFFLMQLFLTSAGSLLANGRVLHFPDDRAVGVVYSGSAVDGSYYEVNYREWNKVGEAKGEIAIEADQHVRLQVSRTASSDLSFLQQIDPDGIQLLFLRDTDVSDEQLRFVGRLTDLRGLDLRHCRITDAGIEHLRPLKKLQKIWLDAFSVVQDGFGVGDGAMQVLGEFPELESVTLRLAKVSDAGLRHLVKAKNLRRLGLGGTRVTDAGMAFLHTLPKLESLGLGVYDDGAPVTNEGLRHIGEITWLKNLDLSATRITDDGLVHLQGLTALEDLSVDNTAVTENGLKHLSPLKSLERIRLPGEITDVGAFHLSKLTSLKRISGTLRVTDKGVALLAQLPNLEQLSIGHEGVTDACFEHIPKMLSLKDLSIQNCSVSDEGIVRLVGMDSLEELGLHGTKVSGNGLVFLKDLPNLMDLSLSFARRQPRSDRGIDIHHLRHLEDVTSLKRIQIFGDHLTSADVRYLRNLVSLESLQLDRVPVDDHAAQVIGKLANLTSLRLHESVITDEGLESLSNLKQLRQLYIGGHFTARGIQSLEKLQSLQFVSLSSPYAHEQSGDVLAAAIPALQSVRVVTRSSNPLVMRRDILGNLPPGMRLKGWINVPEGGVSIDDYSGRVVLVHFWGSWNERSVASVPQLKRLHDQYHGRGLTILGIHTTAASENMEQFVRDHAIRWPVAHDVDNVTRRSWEIDSFPSNFLIDRNGLIRHADVRAEYLARHVATLLDNEE